MAYKSKYMQSKSGGKTAPASSGGTGGSSTGYKSKYFQNGNNLQASGISPAAATQRKEPADGSKVYHSNRFGTITIKPDGTRTVTKNNTTTDTTKTDSAGNPRVSIAPDPTGRTGKTAAEYREEAESGNRNSWRTYTERQAIGGRRGGELTYKDVEKPTLAGRVVDTASGALKSVAGNAMDLIGTMYQSGQKARDAENKRTLDEYKSSLDRAQQDLAIMEQENFSKPGTWADGDMQSQHYIIEDAQRKYDAMFKVINGQVQQKATEASRDFANDVSVSGGTDIERAKEGLGTVGKIAVDAGASVIQMGGDAAANALLGTPTSMIPFAFRAMGGGTQQARNDGADFNQQLLYGTAEAAKEVFTEKMFNIAAPFSTVYGSGSLDDVVEGTIRKAVDRFATTEAGKRVLGGGLTYAASALGEGAEEFIGDIMDRYIPLIYKDGTETWSETMENAVYDFLVGTASGAVGVGAAFTYDPKTGGNVDAAPAAPEAVQQTFAGSNQQAAAPETHTILQEAAEQIASDGKISNRIAERIMANQDTMATLQEAAGLSISDSMTKSQQRNAVKMAVQQLASTQEAVPAEQSEITRPQQQTAQNGQNTQNSNDAGGIAYAAYVNNRVQQGKSLGESGKKAFQAAIRPGGDQTTFYKGFMDYYNAGVSGEKLNHVQSQYGTALDRAQQYAAWTSGQNDAKVSLAAEKSGIGNVTVYNEESGLIENDYSAKLPEAQRTALHTAARSLGMKVVLDGSVSVGGRESAANGYMKNGVLHIAADAADSLDVVRRHEVTHRLQELAPDAYRKFRDYVMSAQADRFQAVEDVQHSYYEASNGTVVLSNEEAMDEIAADFAGKALTDEETINRIMHDDRTLGQKLRDVVRELARKFKEMFGKADPTLERAAQLWNKAYKSAEAQASTLQGKNSRDTMGATQYSLKEDLENGRARKETREGFLFRASDDGLTVFEGDAIAYGYRPGRPVSGKSSKQTSRQIQKELTEIGIAAEVIHGPVLWNTNGITGERNVPEAVTLESKKILISDDTTISPRNAAGHEAFHLWKNRADRDSYVETVEDNLIFSSDAFQEYQSAIADAYLGGEADLSNNAQVKKLREELFAYISGDIHEGANAEYLRPMFHDYDAVKAAWERLVDSNKTSVDANQFADPSAAVESSDADTRYSLRKEDPPKKTITAYKVFVAFTNDPGHLYPPMVASPGGQSSPVGVWVNADTGSPARNKDGTLETTKTTGRLRVQQGGKGTNKAKSGSLGWRPGWHLGEWPDAIQFAVNNPETGKKELLPENFVFAKCEIAADQNYQLEALEYGVTEKGSFNRTQAGLPYIPKDGYYKYRTNANPDTAPWYITGSMKVVELLDDETSRKICAEHGVTPLARRGGNIDLSKFGLKAGAVEPTSGKDLEQYAQVKPQDYSDEVARMPGYVRRALNFKDKTFQHELEIDRVDGSYYEKLYNDTHAKDFAQSPEIRYGDGKTKFSMKDSSGKKLTDEQAEFFKDSKAVDESGQLLVLYHGTAADFTVFDKNRIGQNYGISTGDDLGFYFTPYKGDASSFASNAGSNKKIMSVYLNLTNPLVVEDDGWGSAAGQADVRHNDLKRWAKAGGHDGIIVRSMDEIMDDDGTPDSVYITFSPEQIKNTDNLKPTDDPDIRFSLKAPVEETRDLLAMHNLTDRNLDDSLKLGGLPMPSIAVVKAEQGHTKYGPISFVFSKDTIDPKASSANKVYGGDAFTPTAPSVEYPVNYDAVAKFNSSINQLAKSISGGMFSNSNVMGRYGMDDNATSMSADDIAEKLSGSETVQAAYLASKGLDITPAYKEKAYDQYGNDFIRKIIDGIPMDKRAALANGTTDDINLSDEEVAAIREVWRKDWIDTLPRFTRSKKTPEQIEELSYKKAEGTVTRFRAEQFYEHAMNMLHDGENGKSNELDRMAMTAELEKKAPAASVKAWILPQLDGMLGTPGIYNGKDRFTASGNSRSFKALHLDYTLENIVKAMKTTQSERGEATFGFGAGALVSVATPSYKNIQEIKADSGRLQQEDDDSYNALKDKLDDDINGVISRILKTTKHHSDNEFEEMDIIGTIMKDAAQTSKTIDAIVKTFAKEGYKISTTSAKEMQDIFKQAATFPTGYFEAKPQRAVGFEEVVVAAIPDDLMDRFEQRLKDAGVQNVVAYKTGDDADRMRAVNAFDGVKFSLKDRSPEAMVGKLQEMNQYLREQMTITKGAKTDSEAVDTIAGSLLKDYSSSYDRSALTGRIQALFDWIANGKDSAGNELTWNGLKDEAVSIAGDVLDESLELNDDMYRDYKYLRDKVRTTKLLVPENLRSEIYGGYDDFRKANFGKMQLSGKDGLPVDVFFQELSGLYPEFFDEAETMHPADQLSRIADVLNDLQPVYENRFSGNRQAAEYLADDLIERFYETPQQKPTFADRQQASKSDAVAKERLKNADLRQQAKQDKADASLAGQMAQGRKDAKILRTATNRASRQQARLETRLEALRKQKNERIDTIRKQGREAVKQAQADARQRREETVKAITEKYRGKEQTGREKRSNAARRRQIARHCKDLSQKLLNPSDKRHVPETLRGPVAAMLESINQESAYELEYSKDGKYHRVKPGESRFSEITNRTSAFRKLKEAYAAVLKDGSSGIVLDPSLFGSDVDGVQGNFDKVLSMENIPLADMNGEQLETVWQVVRAVEQSINNAGKVLSGAKFQATTEWADAIAADTASRRDKRSITKNHVLLDMETPYTFFSHYGESGKAIYRMLRDAQDRQQIMVDEAADAISGIVKPKQVQAFEKETHQFTTERGDTLTLNTAQCMEIYELMKREQAQDHLMKGGIVQPEIKSAKIRRGTDSILLSANDLAQIVGVLTDEQTSIADAMQKLTTGMLAGWGNEASMAAYGYKKFTAKDYWPIKSAKEEVHSSVEKGGNNPRSIKNIGMAQSVMPHASNALDVRGIFDTFSSHTGDMADYAAWLLPMEDANRLYNFRYKTADGYTGKTVKGILDRVGGTGSQSYWRDLMEDIQNGIGGNNDSRMASTVGKIIGNAKGAAVGGNIRVVIQQPTAFFRAAVVLSPENMAKGLAAGATKGNGWKKALQYSGIAMRKDQGGFEISSPLQMGEILFDKRSGLRKVSDAFSWAAGKADAVTWGRMWNACEWQTKQTHKNLDVGSKAFYDETEKLFAEVIDQSQVVDGVLQRSQIMRSSNALNKQATAFMGEPTMSFNLMLRAWDQLRYENNPQKRASAIKHLGRAATALVVTDIVNSLAQSIADAERDDDDDKKYWERFWAAFTGITGDEETPWEKAQAFILGSNVMDNMNPLGRIPYVKDMLSLLQGYKVTRMDADVIADILDAAQTVADSAGGNGKKTRAYAVKELANQVGKLFGISGGNILRDVWGIARSAAVETDNLPLQYEMERAIYNISHDANKSRYMDLLFKAKQSGDKETYKRIHDDVIAAGITDDDKIADAMNDRYKKTDAYSSAQEGLASSQTALLQRNGQYGRMNAEYQEKADDWLTGYSKAKALAQTSPDYEMSKQYQKMDDLSKSGVEPWKYALFRAALAMQDDQNKDVEKRNGSYDKAEIQAAADSLPGLTQATKDKLIAAAKG